MSSFNVGSISGSIELSRKPAIDALKAVKAEATGEFKPAVEGAFKDAELQGKKSAEGVGKSWKETLGGIKGEFGRRSAFGETVELLAGGGVIMGASLLGEKLKEFTGKLADLKKETKETGAGWGELTGKVMSSLPVFGSAWDAGQNIREIFTGEKAAVEELEETTRRQVAMTNAVYEQRKKGLLEGIELTKSWGRVQDELNDKIKLMNAGPGESKKIEDEAGLRKSYESIDDKADKERQDIAAKKDAAYKIYYAALAGIPSKYIGTERSPIDPDTALNRLKKEKSANGPYEVLDAGGKGTQRFYADYETAKLVAGEKGGVGLGKNPKIDKEIADVERAGSNLKFLLDPLEKEFTGIGKAATAAGAALNVVREHLPEDARIKEDIESSDAGFKALGQNFDQFLASRKLGLEDRAAKAKDDERFAEEARSTRESLESPKEKALRNIEKLRQDKLQYGLSDAEVNRGAAEIWKGYQSEVGSAGLPQFMKFGGAEDMKLRFENAHDKGADTMQKVLDKLGKIEDAIRANGTPPVVDISALAGANAIAGMGP